MPPLMREACETLTRNANGRRGNVIPAPTAYELLGNLKVLLWPLREIADFLPTGLENSLRSTDITVLDSGFIIGEERDPKASVVAATQALRAIWLAPARTRPARRTSPRGHHCQGYEPKRPAEVGRVSM